MFEWMHLTKTGDARIIEVSLTMFDEKAKTLLVYWRDITQRMSLEREVLATSSLLERTGRLAKVGGWEYKQKKLTLSSQSAQLFNLPNAGIYSARHILKHFTQASRKRLLSHILYASKKANNQEIEIEVDNQDRRTLWLRVACEQIQDDSDLHIIGAFQDITEIKKAHEVKKAHQKIIKQGHLQLMQSMSLAMEKRDPYTAGHQNRVADLSREIAIRLGWKGERIDGLVLGATLHDLGKIAIPAEILTRPGKISKEEFNLIMRHPILGYGILQDVNFPWPISKMVKQHHERIDGSGYPDGLTVNEIIPEAKVIAVADIVEAMASPRPYRSALGVDAALQEIFDCRGNSLDSDIVDACISTFASGFHFES
jgi:HD-GYP domain-containing protein (c-di-GMP phosphodiesterase class II)